MSKILKLILIDTDKNISFGEILKIRYESNRYDFSKNE